MTDTKRVLRTFRVDEGLWESVKLRAEDDGLTATEVIRGLLTAYTEGCEECEEAEEFKDYSPEQREKMAKDGRAMPDGSFPIADCADLKNAIRSVGRASDVDAAKAHIRKRAKALSCADVEINFDAEVELLACGCQTRCTCGSCGCDTPTAPAEEPSDPVTASAQADPAGVAAIHAVGALSASEDPETQAAVARVRELLLEGAVGVSIAHDMNPDDMPEQEEIDALIAEENFEALDALFQSITVRPRHVAIVDTPAFADARLTLGEDGVSVTGPVTFEGLWSGDMRSIPFGALTWDTVLPIPIIWDRHEGDHTGMTVGSITALERVEGETSALRVADQAVAAAAAPVSLLDSIPATVFAQTRFDSVQPLHIDLPLPNGLRRIYGHAAPKGVCHRSDMGACFQYPGDVDPTMRHFHTGTSLTLDDGSTVRVGALTLGGLHLDTRLARQGVSARDANRHREDANQVFALVRAWADPFGLAISGVVVPGVTDAQMAQAMASAPSVELWPEASGRTLVGVHLVPTPAWPVAASAGSAISLTTGYVVAEMPEVTGEADPMEARLDRIERALALLVADKIADGIPID